MQARVPGRTVRHSRRPVGVATRRNEPITYFSQLKPHRFNWLRSLKQLAKLLQCHRLNRDVPEPQTGLLEHQNLPQTHCLQRHITLQVPMLCICQPMLTCCNVECWSPGAPDLLPACQTLQHQRSTMHYWQWQFLCTTKLLQMQRCRLTCAGSRLIPASHCSAVVTFSSNGQLHSMLLAARSIIVVVCKASHRMGRLHVLPPF